MSATIASPTVAYQEYADREVKWLGLLPGHWKPQRLGTIAEMRVSNVDKHSKEEELPVRLCNYVDVYKNDHISRDMPFMRATASTEEIGRFRLRKYDVLITKDSETWDDIGVPALVTEPADDLISGYHLALLRPNGDILGPYLFRTLQSRGVAQQFHIGANGVTRYGLTHNTIRSVILPLPPLDEQAAIVRYLDDADQRIRAYVSAKERLIALLEEERQAVSHEAVKRCRDPKGRESEALQNVAVAGRCRRPIGRNDGELHTCPPVDRLFNIDRLRGTLLSLRRNRPHGIVDLRGLRLLAWIPEGRPS